MDDRIVGLEFIMEHEVLVVGTVSGELLSVNTSTQSVEVVGKVDGGIVRMSSSPDGELLAVATGLGLLLLMTQDWEALHEIFLEGHDLHQGRSTEVSEQFNTGTNAPLQITWRGDGKYFATLGGDLQSSGTKQLRIWERESGALHSCSKPFSCTSMVLDWIANGARLATACSHSPAGASARILFFERNGLERGFVDIDGPVNTTIGQIKWNSNSELLAVLLRCSDWDAIQIWSFSNYHWYMKQEWRYSKGHHVNFFWDPEKPMCLVTWTVSGLVQLITLCWDSAVANESVSLVIDGSCLLVTPLTLALIPPPMSLFKLKFESPIQTVALHKLGVGHIYIAASLSDGTINLLALPNTENWDTLEGTEAVISSASVLEQHNTFFCMQLLSWLDSNHLLGVMSCSEMMPSINSLQKDHVQSLFNPNSSKQDSYLSSEILVEIEVHWSRPDFVADCGLGISDWLSKSIKQTLLKKGVMAIADHPSGSGLFVHLEDGSIFLYTLKRGLFREEAADSIQSLFSPSLWIRALSIAGSKNVVLIALDGKGKLQVESQILCSDCTSFTVHIACINEREVIHVVYTTRQDVLYIVNLEEALGIRECAGTVQNTSELSSGETPRTEKKDMFKAHTLWERGAKVITALGGCSVAVVLQTVRGNLETIYPRNLVLGSIAAALCQCSFNDAILLARQHHISLNLIVDFRGWEAFIQVATEFVKQVKNLNYVTELVCAVSTGNAMDGIYKDLLLPYTNEVLMPSWETGTIPLKSSESSSLTEGNKVHCVLHAIRKALLEEVAESPKRELCILTTMARSDPPELGEALQRIKKLREEEMEHPIENLDVGLVDHATKKLRAEEALKHLLWLSDPESVFDAALGLYDLHLAAMVASSSQHDPKEFLPLLEELEEMPSLIMRYTIDYRLQKFESALRNLAAAGNSHFNECLELIKSNPKLFALGKELFKEAPERMAILEAWGDHLVGEQNFEDAAAAFCCCSQLQKAMEAYRAGGLWQGVLVVAGMLGLPHEHVIKLAQELREELQALGRPADAAKIALEYCKDVEDAVLLFIEAREWSEAVRVAYSHCKVEQVKDQVQPAALECAKSYMLEFEEGLEKVGKYLARYHAVKQRRLFFETKLKMDTADELEDDVASDVSSNISGMSAYTTGTRFSKVSMPPSSASTNGPKQSRRRQRGGKIRAGSPGEEIALAEHLKSMELTTGKLEEIKRLLNILVLLGHNIIAEKLQHLALQFQSSQCKAVTEMDGGVERDQANMLQWFMEVLRSPPMAK